MREREYQDYPLDVGKNLTFELQEIDLSLS